MATVSLAANRDIHHPLPIPHSEWMGCPYVPAMRLCLMKLAYMSACMSARPSGYPHRL